MRQELVEARRRSIEEALEAALPAASRWPARLHEAVRYSLFAGGKRIRPRLAIAACVAVGGAPRDALPLACALEMVHTFSLIHDDLPAMDDDDLRRGRPTCHKAFGEAMAILAGDALLARAFERLAELPADAPAELARRRLQAISTLGAASGTLGLVGGQADDIEHEGKALAPPALERMHRAKTGALIEAAVRGGAVLGGADAVTLEPLARYAAAVGLAFQIVDDVLDATESAERLGKTAGKDARAGKATWVSVHGLEPARARAQALLAEGLAALDGFDARADELRELARQIVERRS
jgi:geranylgeranyl diphosphate synthase type II